MGNNKIIIGGACFFAILSAMIIIFFIAGRKSDASMKNTYIDSQYNYKIKYPEGWKPDKDEYMLGVRFSPMNMSIKKIAEQKYDAQKDCFYQIAVLARPKENKISCSNQLGQILLGEHQFTKCKGTDSKGNPSVDYMLIHPKTGRLLVASYLSNSNCLEILEHQLKSLSL